MIAVAILGVSLTVILQLFSGSLLSAEKTGEHTKATMYAKQKMDELLSDKEFKPGQYSGDLSEENYRWQAEITPFIVSGDDSYKNLPGELFEIKLKILWTASGTQTQKASEFSTLKYVPKTPTE